MRLLCVLMVVTLAACDTRSPYFKDVPARRVIVNDLEFSVRHKGRLAEAVRVSSQWMPNLQSVAPFAETAIREATGCDVRELRGDASFILGILACKENSRPQIAPHLRRTPSCEAVDVFVPAGGTIGHLEVECD
jgi:hypothetical protein